MHENVLYVYENVCVCVLVRTHGGDFFEENSWKEVRRMSVGKEKKRRRKQ